MSLKLQILIITCMLLAIVVIFRKIGKNKLDFKLGLLWVVISIVVMIFAIWPGLLSRISQFLGIYDPVNMLFFFGIILLVMIIFALSSEISKLKEQVKRLSQEIAILRKDTYDDINKNQKG